MMMQMLRRWLCRDIIARMEAAEHDLYRAEQALMVSQEIEMRLIERLKRLESKTLVALNDKQ